MKQLFLTLLTFTSIHLIGQTTRNISDFSALSIGGDVKAELIKSTSPRIEITMIKGKETDLTTEVNSGELKVRIKNNYWGKNTAKASVKIYYVNLQEISASAGSNLSSKENIQSNSMFVDVSSGASVKLWLTADKLDVKASSGSSITLNGQCTQGKFAASSGASISASSFNTTHASAYASSGSSVDIMAIESIDADSSSGGSVRYKGNPKNKKLSSNMSGGTISKE